ncbi:MAG: STAS domain-containing protein, partial [Spirulina sp.]
TQVQKIPRSETAAMVTTVAVTIFSHNLAIGVVVGIALSTVFFSRKIAKVVFVDRLLSEDGLHRIYSIGGQIFFVAIDDLLEQFDFHEEREKITLDFTHAHIWDQSAVGAIDQIVLKFRRTGADVELVGLNEASAALLDKLAIHNDPKALEKMSSH